MLDKELAKKQIKEHCGDGWLFLVDIIYDNAPNQIKINEIFQKWAGLEIRFEGTDAEFNELVENVNFMSKRICEKCGKSGAYSIIDGWETTLCDLHYKKSNGKKKYRRENEFRKN